MRQVRYRRKRKGPVKSVMFTRLNDADLLDMINRLARRRRRLPLKIARHCLRVGLQKELAETG